MTLATRGMGAANGLCIFGMGPYKAYLIPENEQTGGSGFVSSKFEVSPRRIYLKKEPGEPALRLSDIEPKKAKEVIEAATVVTVDEERYEVAQIPPPTPAAALKLLDSRDLAEKIKAVQEELAVTKAEAREALKVRAEKEVKAAERFKMALIRDDEELALIIIMSEV